MTSQGSSSRGKGQNAATPPPPRPGPKLQVQRSLSRDTITIHFSALGKEEEEEDEELYGMVGAGAPASGVGGLCSGPEDQGVAPALEVEEELLFEAGEPKINPIAPPCVQPPAVGILSASGSSQSSLSATPSGSSSWPPERPAPVPSSASPGASPSPSKSSGLSSSKPFLSLVRSLSNDMESRDSLPSASPSSPSITSSAALPPARHRHLMKSFVKSLSTDPAKAEHQEAAQPPHPQAWSQRPPPESTRRNVQLFKQFSQPRLSTGTAAVADTGADSKTAPSSPLTSPADGRSFFKVQEVEARLEDTRRRLSEAMCDPLLLLSKIMGEEAGPGASVKFQPGGAAEPVNGHTAEANNNYSIKEEEGGEEEHGPTAQGSDFVCFSFPSLGQAPASSAPLPRSPSLGLARCSMSALAARQEDEDFCELYSEDFEPCTDTETPEGDRKPGLRQARTASTTSELEPEESEDGEVEEESVPTTALVFLTQMVYWYLVLPVPQYVCAVVQGVAAGFLLALLVLWLAAPRGSPPGPRRDRRRGELWNMAQLDLKEPGIFKGWMNEICSYDPETYHATLTHSVYVRLEGSVLRLSKPNRNIPRRATHNEAKPDVTYISQKIYDLTDSKIHLVPGSLARKRVWNKKYPICIKLAKQEDFMARAQGERPDAGEEKAAGLEKLEKVEGPGADEEPNKRPASGGGDLTLYLFGRTGREKEEWFRRILVASRLKSEGRSLPGLKSAFLPSHSRSGSGQSGSAGGTGGGAGSLGASSRSSSRSSLDEVLQGQPQPRHRDPPAGGATRPKMLLDYNIYMAKYVTAPAAPDSPSACSSPGHSPEGSPGPSKTWPRSLGEHVEPEAWVNALLGRIFWDFLVEKYWADMVSKKIQMKISKIRLPYFMNELTLTELDMGFALPKILHAAEPSVDHQGLWFDLEVSYSGSFLMTLETKMNLARLGKEAEGPGEQGKEGSRPRAYCLADSDEESSSAGSSDEEDAPEVLADLPGTEGYVGGHRPSKIMRFVDKIAKSKYFQKATETEFIRKKMEEMSNTPLLLTVEVQECRGTMAVNIPPPPTDRIWYGFRSPPHLELKARPKLGEREVTLAHVTDWIEKKLDQEFQKIFVMPNMDDIWLPIMHSAMDTRSNANLVTVTTDALRDSELPEADIDNM